MSEKSWDAEEFEENTAAAKVVLPKAIPLVTDKWEGEDEDETVRNNWDEEDEEEEKPKENAESGSTAIQVKKKKKIIKSIAEKEEQVRKELEEKKKQQLLAEEAKKQMTPKERQEERTRHQKQVEEADLALAIDMMGLREDKATVGQIDALTPTTREEFDKLSELLVNKLQKVEASPFYASFLETLYRNLALSVESEDVKRFASTLSALATEKAKLKPKTGKKGAGKKGKASLVVGKDTDNINDDNAAGYRDDFDDYL